MVIFKKEKQEPKGNLRLDPEFSQRLTKLNYELASKGIIERASTPLTTKEILTTESWKKVEKELNERKKDKFPDLMFDKRGFSIFQLFILLGVMLVFAISIVIIVFWGNTLATAFKPVADNLNSPGVNATMYYNQTIGQIPGGFASLQWITYGILIAMFLSVIISASLSRKHPVILVPYGFIVLVLVFFAAIISNAYESIMKTPGLVDTFNQFYGMNFIMLNLPYIVAVVGIIGTLLSVINIYSNPEAGY